jgi:large subunit ribosomal protein L23
MAIFQRQKSAAPSAPNEKALKSALPEVRVGASAKLLLTPLVTEKSIAGEKRGIYTFRVTWNASKGAIADAFYAAYGEKPAAVRVLAMPGKVRRYGRSVGRTDRWKKAIVQLPSGKTVTTSSPKS